MGFKHLLTVGLIAIVAVAIANRIQSVHDMMGY